MVTGPARRYNVTISRLMPIYNGNGARQGAQQSLFVCQVEEKMVGNNLDFLFQWKGEDPLFFKSGPTMNFQNKNKITSCPTDSWGRWKHCKNCKCPPLTLFIDQWMFRLLWNTPKEYFSIFPLKCNCSHLFDSVSAAVNDEIWTWGLYNCKTPGVHTKPHNTRPNKSMQAMPMGPA